MNALTAKIANLNIKMLKEMAFQLNEDFRDGADLVHSAVMDRLMQIMPEAEFVALCGELEG